MSRARLLTIALVSLLLINVGTLSFVFISMRRTEPREPMPLREGGPRSLIIARLGFDAAQQAAYELIIDEHRGKTHVLNRESRDFHNALYALLKEKTIDRAKADALINAIAQNQKDIDNLNFDHFQKIKAICRNEQLERFNALAGDLARLFGGPPQ